MAVENIARTIVDTVGINNIQTISHCATRIRIVPQDAKKIQPLAENEVIKGSLFANKEFQVFIRLGELQEVYQEIEQIIANEK